MCLIIDANTTNTIPAVFEPNSKEHSDFKGLLMEKEKLLWVELNMVMN